MMSIPLPEEQDPRVVTLIDSDDRVGVNAIHESLCGPMGQLDNGSPPGVYPPVDVIKPFIHNFGAFTQASLGTQF